jgi:hypothetical protein
LLERLIENWLDNAGERSYQRCFCQMLTGLGYRIIHNTEHTPLEFGKDVIAISPDGKLIGYQLKGHPGGTLKPYDFNEIRPQLDQLATLALAIPGMTEKIPDECYLVTNGEIDEAVYQQITLMNASLVTRGFSPDRIKTITRGTLLDWAKSLGLSLWPSEMEDFGNLVKLLNCRGDEIFPAEIFDPLLQNTLRFKEDVKAGELRRRVTSAAIMTSLALHSFSRQRNHYAEMTAWVMFMTYTIAACEKNNVDFEKNCAESVLVARDGVYDLLGLLCEELIDRKTLSEGDPYADFPFYRPRALLLYGLLSIYWIWSEAEGWKREHHKAVVEKTIPKDLPPQWLWGEAAIPQFLTYIWYVKKIDPVYDADLLVAGVLAAILRNKLTPDSVPLASPYYDVEEVMRSRNHQMLGCDDPFEGDTFDGISYFCESLMTCLIRAGRKDLCVELWPDFTRVVHERVVPEHPWRFCLYRTGDGATNQSIIIPSTGQWNEQREAAKDVSAPDIAAMLKKDPVILLLFTNIFPFRASFSAVKFLHRHFDKNWTI